MADSGREPEPTHLEAAGEGAALAQGGAQEQEQPHQAAYAAAEQVAAQKFDPRTGLPIAAPQPQPPAAAPADGNFAANAEMMKTSATILDATGMSAPTGAPTDS